MKKILAILSLIFSATSYLGLCIFIFFDLAADPLRIIFLASIILALIGIVLGIISFIMRQASVFSAVGVIIGIVFFPLFFVLTLQYSLTADGWCQPKECFSFMKKDECQKTEICEWRGQGNDYPLGGRCWDKCAFGADKNGCLNDAFCKWIPSTEYGTIGGYCTTITPLDYSRKAGCGYGGCNLIDGTSCPFNTQKSCNNHPGCEWAVHSIFS